MGTAVPFITISTGGGGNKVAVAVAVGRMFVGAGETSAACPKQLAKRRIRKKYISAREKKFLFSKRLASRLYSG